MLTKEEIKKLTDEDEYIYEIEYQGGQHDDKLKITVWPAWMYDPDDETSRINYKYLFDTQDEAELYLFLHRDDLLKENYEEEYDD